MTRLWKKGRGKLGFLDPLIGTWRAKTVSENGPVDCVRRFEPVLKDGYVRLTAHWKVGPAPEKQAGKAAAAKSSDKKAEGVATAGGNAMSKPGTTYTYDEIALIGSGGERSVRFWSFTSDGKHAYGVAADATDLHPEAIGFEANVMGRQARQAYFPAENGDVIWVVEAKAKKGWNRFVEHRYKRIEAAGAAAAPKKADEKPKKGEDKPKSSDAKAKKAGEGAKKSTSS